MREVREGEEKRILHWNILDYILRGLYCCLDDRSEAIQNYGDCEQVILSTYLW